MRRLILFSRRSIFYLLESSLLSCVRLGILLLLVLRLVLCFGWVSQATDMSAFIFCAINGFLLTIYRRILRMCARILKTWSNWFPLCILDGWVDFICLFLFLSITWYVSISIVFALLKLLMLASCRSIEGLPFVLLPARRRLNSLWSAV